MTPGTLVATASSDLVESAASHWATRRVGDLVKLINGFPFDSNRFGPDGTPLLRVRDLDSDVTETQYEGPILSPFLIENADLLVGMDGDFNVGRWRGSKPALLNQRVLALRGSSKVVRWLEYALPEPLKQINDLTYSTTVKHLSSAQVRAIRIRVPENLTDHLDYLDRETAEIDAFIADQEKLIELLTERQSATITHSVLRSLDEPDRRTGIPWFSRVPAAWSTGSLRHYARTTDGAHISPEQEGGVFPFVSTRDVQGGLIDIEGALRTSPPTYDYMVKTGCAPRPGNILFSKDGTVGRTAIVVEGPSFVVASSLIIIKPDAQRTSPEMMNYVLMSTPVQEQIRSFVKGAGLPRLSITNLQRVQLFMPPLHRQSEIVSEIKESLAEIDSTLADAREAIALSKERRAALISAAVTGKIDVREHGKVHA